MDEEEHEVYGGEIPIEGDMEPHGADVDMATADDDAVKVFVFGGLKELDEMKKRLKEMEDEAAALREMQAKVEKEMGSVQADPASTAASQENREEVDSRSIFVGNSLVTAMQILVAESDCCWQLVDVVFRSDWLIKPVLLELRRPWSSKLLFSSTKDVTDPIFLSSPYSTMSDAITTNVSNELVDYACTPEEVQQHFQACGTVNRVTILTDKFGQPKGFAYVEFIEQEAIQEALQLNESELHGRQLKVMPKRTNVPGMKQFRPGRFNPYLGGYRSRRPYAAPIFYSPYGYGKVPRFRRPGRFMSYY
ncbi:hypothetical protein H5410_054752 [Solanum commersonii]|uniref:RRM domain-containing protein n=1 Tax=Solanum commersonii TaxID=4109 RepID=A0A9J5WG66_SOLCO|nr:hypothetical protein H5410_054752 [Solanum commersonii]